MRFPELDLRTEALAESWRQLRSAGEEAADLAGGLTRGQLWWRPGPERWSVGACLDHLVRTGEAYLEVVDEHIDEARRREWLAEGPHGRTLVGRWLPRLLEPPPRLRVPAPRRIRPRTTKPERPATGARDDPLRRFLALRSRLGERLEASEGLDLGQIRMPSPFFSWVRFDLGSAFRIVAAHERRHLWQARRVLQAEGFPRPRRPPGATPG